MVLAPGNTAYWTRYTHSPLNTRAARDPNKLKREVQRELFFRDELAQLFALSKEENLDITTLTGSYAGQWAWDSSCPPAIVNMQ